MSGKKDSTPYTTAAVVAGASGPARGEARGEPRAESRGDRRGHGLSDGLLDGLSEGHSRGRGGSQAAAVVTERRLQLVRNEHYREASTQSGPPSQRAGKRTVMLDRSLQERIGAILRESFADIEQAPLPERLSKLIEALPREEKRR
jgi:hypothetical protein